MVDKRRPPIRILFRKVILPSVFALSIVAFGTAYYFWRVTDSPFRMPYQIERETYGVAPYLLWQHARPIPTYHNSVMRTMYAQQEVLGYEVFRSFTGALLKIYLFWSFYLGPALSLPFL